MGKNLNMRDWIETLDKAGELMTLNKPVDPKTEMGALLYKSRDKALYFQERGRISRLARPGTGAEQSEAGSAGFWR